MPPAHTTHTQTGLALPSCLLSRTDIHATYPAILRITDQNPWWPPHVSAPEPPLGTGATTHIHLRLGFYHIRKKCSYPPF